MLPISNVISNANSHFAIIKQQPIILIKNNIITVIF